jgi:hypothetical protein
MNPFREEIPDDLSQSPSKWLFEHYEEFSDWMTETQTYEQYLHEHEATPEHPVMPKNWHRAVESI